MLWFMLWFRYWILQCLLLLKWSECIITPRSLWCFSQSCILDAHLFVLSRKMHLSAMPKYAPSCLFSPAALGWCRGYTPSHTSDKVLGCGTLREATLLSTTDIYRFSSSRLFGEIKFSKPLLCSTCFATLSVRGLVLFALRNINYSAVTNLLFVSWRLSAKLITGDWSASRIGS